ncbi:unnamed protein product [Soboliphyme baturini]|uniref:C2 DOCK-type domain-containing protein n=1 Tax=Soboliphyme baturini TaxID=241478 RepID=A0A183IZX9_9BILA|nr:unnamed protein product [Soboliphyme baturini]
MEKSSDMKWTQGSWNVLLTFLDFLCPCSSKLEISFMLYDAKEGNFISECFTIILPYFTKHVDGDTTRNSAIGNQDQRILFTDLGTKDLEREHLFLLCRVVKVGPLEPKETLGGRRGASSTAVRQMYGIGLLNLSEFLKTKQFLFPRTGPFYSSKNIGLPEDSEEKQTFVTLYSLQDESVDQLVKKLTESNYTESDGDLRSQGLYLSVQFLCGNFDEVKNTYAHLFTPMPALIRKMGFPEVIFRDDVRNDLYVTLVGGDFSHCGRSDKNIEVRVCLISENANLDVPHSISVVGSKTFKEDYYLSTVYYHQDKPRWFETVKFSIPVEQYSNIHVQFMFKHRSSNESKDKAEKPFAISFIRLRQSEGTVLRDGQHDMLVYRLERKYDELDFSYRTLPATKSDLDMSGWSGMASKSLIQSPTGGFVLSSKDYFTIRSIVCSTSLTQNVDLLGLLDWESKRVNLKHSLEALMKAEGDRGGEEIVKFLQHILDALFSVLINTNDYDQLVFDALVYVIGLVGERRYHNFKPVMDTYLHSHFSAALAYQKLIPILKDYVDNVEQSSGKLLKALKSLEYLIKFIVKSRELYMQLKGPTAGQERFQSLLRALLVSISSLMLCRSDQSLLCQGAALKYMPCIVGDVMIVFDAEDLS